jgi:hypothetical protein
MESHKTHVPNHQPSDDFSWDFVHDFTQEHAYNMIFKQQT